MDMLNVDLFETSVDMSRRQLGLESGIREGPG